MKYLNDIQEELMDAVLYIQTAREEIEDNYTYPEFVRNGKLIGDKVGLYEVENQLSFFEVRSKKSFQQAEDFINLKNLI